jgi:hypothetical protein
MNGPKSWPARPERVKARWRQEAGRSRAFHQCDRRVAANAVAGEHDSGMRRLHIEPLLAGVDAQRGQSFLINLSSARTGP